MLRFSPRWMAFLSGTALVFSLLTPEAQAFGGFLKNAAKNRAKQDAKRRARQEAEKAAKKATGVDLNAVSNVANNPTEALKSTATEALTEATGVDINQVAGMADNPTAAAEGMLSSAIPPALRGYVGKNKDQIIESLQAEIYQQKGLSRFSPPAQRRSAEAEARSQAADILSQLSKFPQGNGLAGQIAGTLSAAAQGAAEVVASGSSDVGANRDAVLARVQAEVYAQRGIAPGTTGFKKTMADKIVEQRVKQLLGN